LSPTSAPIRPLKFRLPVNGSLEAEKHLVGEFEAAGAKAPNSYCDLYGPAKQAAEKLICWSMIREKCGNRG